jgi:hypothetical protein
MLSNPREIITSAEWHCPVRIRIAVSPNGLGQLHTQITNWPDASRKDAFFCRGGLLS